MKNDVSAIPAGKSNYLKRLLFLLVCVLMSGNAVWAQQPTITIHAKNQSLKEVLKEIEQELCMERPYAYNHTRPSEHAKRAQPLKEMLAECGAGCWIEPPFHTNWGGKHKHLGDFLLR